MSGGLGIALSQLIVPAAAGLLGVLVGGWITGYNQKKERLHNHVREQLRDFYAPLLSMRKEIRSKSELRVKLHTMVDKAWQKRIDSVRDDPQTLIAVEKARGPQFDKVFDYSDKQLTNELIPQYREMLEHFKKYIWLAEPSTLTHFTTLVEYVEIWNRFMASSLPSEVLKFVDHREEKLSPFYEDLERQEKALREKLSR
jgi:hypothetical protein